MNSRKALWRDVKLFLRIFCILFVIIFFIFDGTAFGTIATYKINKWFHLAKANILEPPELNIKPIVTTTAIKSTVSTTKLNIPLPSTSLPLIPSTTDSTNLIVLPKFNIKAPIISVNTTDLSLIYKKLKEGVVLYPGSAIPGKGYSIIIGHSSQYPWQPGRYKSVFSLLSELEIGDKIYVYWEQKPLIFEVTDTKIFLPFPKGTETTESIFPPENKPILILQSCWPVGVAYKRVAVKTILVSE